MIDAILRLEFSHVFPEEKPLDIMEYLANVSDEMLLNIIGFTNTNPQPNFDDFHTNLDTRKDVTERVIAYCELNGIKKKPQLVSREGALRLAELILTNRETLLNKDSVFSRTSDELNLFKAILIVNKDVNSNETSIVPGNGVDYIADLYIGMAFGVSELGLSSNNNFEFIKLLYTTIVRFEFLLEFLQAESDRSYLVNDLVDYFNQTSAEELMARVKKLIAHLAGLKAKNGYKISVESSNDMAFLDTLVSTELYEDDDFTQLKNNP